MSKFPYIKIHKKKAFNKTNKVPVGGDRRTIPVACFTCAIRKKNKPKNKAQSEKNSENNVRAKKRI